MDEREKDTEKLIRAFENRQVGPRLKKQRLKQGRQRVEMCGKKLTQDSLYNYEVGKRRMPYKAAKAVAKKLKVNLFDLILNRLED